MVDTVKYNNIKILGFTTLVLIIKTKKSDDCIKANIMKPL
jgi:hypothetical protein